MSRLIVESFGRRLTNVSRRFFTKITRVEFTGIETKTIVPAASNRVAILFRAALVTMDLIPSNEGNTFAYKRIDADESSEWLEVEKHYSLVQSEWKATSGGPGTITVFEILFRG